MYKHVSRIYYMRICWADADRIYYEITLKRVCEFNFILIRPICEERFLIKKNQLDALISQIYSWNEALHVSDSSSVHHQEFFHCTHSNGICYKGLLTACEQNILILLASCLQTCMTYTIVVCTVKNSGWWTEELSETCRFSFQE